MPPRRKPITTPRDDIAAASLRFAQSSGDTALIPAGRYCFKMEQLAPDSPVSAYAPQSCPYWADLRPVQSREAPIGYCALLAKGSDPSAAYRNDQKKGCEVNTEPTV